MKFIEDRTNTLLYIIILLITIVLILFCKLSFAQPHLITTSWSTGTYYNYLHPYDNNGNKTNVNHHAVAVGQLMNYWQHPHKGWGNMTYTSNCGLLSADFEHSYNWPLPNDLIQNNIEVSRLLLDIDIALQSNYTNGTQGYNCGIITLGTINQMMHDNFGYNLGNVGILNVQTVINEINLGYPVMMEAYPTNGQCSRFLLIDGYYNGLFHINWGLGWFYNEWSLLSNLDLGGIKYTLNQTILSHVVPDSIILNGIIHNDATMQPEASYGFFGDENLQFDAPLGLFSDTLEKEWYEISAYSVNEWSGVNSADALTILKHFVGMTQLTGLKLKCADVNADNTINSIDAMMCAKRFVGLINSFDTGDWMYSDSIINSDTTININVRCIGDVN